MSLLLPAPTQPFYSIPLVLYSVTLCTQHYVKTMSQEQKKKQLSQTLHRTSSFGSPHYFESYYAVILTFLFRAAMQRDRIGPTTGPYSVAHKIPFKLKHYFTPALFPTSWCRFNASACLHHIPWRLLAELLDKEHAQGTRIEAVVSDSALNILSSFVTLIRV